MELQKLESITKDVLREFNDITYSINTSKSRIRCICIYICKALKFL